jgi:hypothetical protein
VACWSGATIIGAIAWWLFKPAGVSLAYAAAMAAAALLVGLITGFVLEMLVRQFTGLLAGGLVGYVIALPPALQLAQWLAALAAQAAEGASSLAFVAYGAIAAIIASQVLSAGSALGMFMQAALAVLFRHVVPPAFAARVWPPGWRALRITILLAALAGALFYADRRVGLPWPDAEPPVASPWVEREKALFRDVLASRRYELLVLPVQSDGASFDRIERSLMTRYIAYRVGQASSLAVPDPTLMARAMDARAREFELQDGFALAEALGARKVIASTVRRTGQTFTVSAQLWSRDSESVAWRQQRAARLESLAYGDRLPASVALRERLDTLLGPLGINVAPRARAPLAESQAPPVGDLLRLSQLSEAPPLQQALHLQLYAALHERETIAAETLWERSLVALWAAGDTSERKRLLETRAYLHLSRRPYALELLGSGGSAAADALRAALDGNLPALEAAAPAIEDPALRLFAELELCDLYDAFGLRKRLIERRKAMLERPLTDALALDARLSAPEWFRADIHRRIAERLKTLAPLARSWEELAGQWLRWFYWQPNPLDEANLALARRVELAFAPLWRANADKWTSKRTDERLGEADYYELLFAANQNATFKAISSTLFQQDLPQRAAAIIERLASPFAGQPRMTQLHAVALDKLARNAPPGTMQRLQSRSSALALSAYRWEGGESHVSAAAEHYIYERPYQKYLDEPVRWYRGEVASERLQFERVSFSEREMQRNAADAARRLAYSDRNARPLRELVRWLRRAGRTQEALAVVQENAQRFVGTAAHAELLAEASESGAADADTLAAYRELLQLDPDSWDARRRVAMLQMERGEPRRAQETFLAFPGFADREGQNVVGLSNRAFEAGQYLYRRGEPALAEPLFMYSARLGTGAAAEMHSRELLALMESDLGAAMREARHQVERYQSGAAAMRYLAYLFVQNKQSDAWAAFGDFANRFGDETVWSAAYIAHRLQGVEGAEVEAWLADQSRQDTRRDYLTNALRERHAFMLAFIDRPASDEAIALVRRVAQANNRGEFYVQLAEGYAAWRRRDYATAIRKLRGPHDDLFNIGVNRRASYSEWLPYLVLAYARTGARAEADKLLANQLVNLGVDSDYLIAQALLAGDAGAHDAALAALRRAFYRLPATSTRSLFPGYVLLEAAELLLVESKNDGYRALIEDVARRLQVELPYAWAAAFEAKYAAQLDDRQVAIAAAAILDPQSERIAHVSPAERAALRRAAARTSSLLGVALRQPAR